MGVVELRTASTILTINERTGALASLRAVHAPDQEFLIPDHGALPLFLIQYHDADHRLHEISSLEAGSVTFTRAERSGVDELCFAYEHVGALDLGVVVTASADGLDRAILWRIDVSMPRPAVVLNIQFPLVVLSYAPDGNPDAAKVLQPYYFGLLHEKLRPHHFAPDFPEFWQWLPENGDANQYPGLTFAQLLAFYNDRAGVLLSCRDATGQVKQLRPVHREPGLRLGVAHITGWAEGGRHELGYPVALECFEGDWYAAAAIYRDWSLQQHWAQTPLIERTDLPPWLADSPLHIVMRIQGEVDAGPVHAHSEFTPYENALPLLNRVADRIGAPLAPIIMSWERPGPWIYPDCFPPAGGAESLQAFSAAAQDRGWHVGTYCNGTRWVTGQRWSGYRGEEYFNEHDGKAGVCRQPDGEPWEAPGNQTCWRPSYPGCVGTDQTRSLLLEYARALRDLGLTWIQILDQNIGCCSFPCYAADHEHAPAPGGWMTKHMESLLATLRAQAQAAGWDGVWSVETPCTEYYLQSFAICDIRPDFKSGFVPLYAFLYHEYIMTQSIFSAAPNPHFLVLKFARALVLGEVLGCHMGAGGRLQNWDPPRNGVWGEPWAPWDSPEGDQDAAYAVLRNAVTLRRSVGKDFLVFGRMLRPLPITGVNTVSWTFENEANSVPAVEHATWQARDGRIAVVLANWTDEEQPLSVDLTSQASRTATLHICDKGAVAEVPIATGVPAALRLQPHASAILVVA